MTSLTPCDHPGCGYRGLPGHDLHTPGDRAFCEAHCPDCRDDDTEPTTEGTNHE